MLLGCSTSSFAQSPSPYPEWIYSAGIPLYPTFRAEVPTWDVAVGLSYEQVSRYAGASRSKPVFGPLVDIRYKDIAFASTAEGIGVNLLSSKSYRAGVAISYNLGRDEQDDSRLNGLGTIHPTAEFKVFGEYVLYPVVIRAAVRQAFSGYGGMIGDLSVYMPVYGSSDNTFFVMAGPALTFEDSKAAQAFFGVSAAQSASSGLPAYSARAGMRSASFGINITKLLGEHWFINGTFAAKYLADEVADSPIVLRRSEGVGGLTVGYNF